MVHFKLVKEDKINGSLFNNRGKLFPFLNKDVKNKKGIRI
jgi:hypothetical protein